MIHFLLDMVVLFRARKLGAVAVASILLVLLALAAGRSRSLSAGVDETLFLPIVMNPRGFEVIASAETYGFVVDITHAGDERLFIVELTGEIYVQQADGSKSLFMDIGDRVVTGGERGLLGLAFHPDYAENGYFYVSYTGVDASDANRFFVSRFSVSADANTADSSSEEIIFSLEDGTAIHNAGQIRFSPIDQHLYLTTGDDANKLSSQDGSSRNGRLLQLNVGDGTEGLLETTRVAKGLRNPWRFAMDPLTGDIYMGDVGSNVAEEINLVPHGQTGLNFGWPCVEGSEWIDQVSSPCKSLAGFTSPIYYYGRDVGVSVTSGEIYRPNNDPNETAQLIFADYLRTHIHSLAKIDGEWVMQELGHMPNNETLIATFGTDIDGTVYIGTTSAGPIYELYIPPR